MDIELKHFFRDCLHPPAKVSILVLMDIELKQALKELFPNQIYPVSILVLMDIELKHIQKSFAHRGGFQSLF